jgi:hypothetical protein
LFHDQRNETLSQFHVVPVLVSAEIKFLFDGKTHGNNAMNCGVYFIFSIQDMVITQRNKQWFVADVFTPKTKDKKEAWKTAIQEKKPMVIPASYKIGTCFIKSPAKAQGADFKRLCDFMRMEFAILMEHLHCIYIEEYSKRDCRTKWWLFGVPRETYTVTIQQDPLSPYIHKWRF